MAIDNATPTPQPLNPADDAKHDFERISQAMHDGGARDAYKVLKEEMDNTKNLSPQERQAWQQEMTSQLTQGHDGAAPLLPRLSLAYLEDNRGAFTTQSSGYTTVIDAGKIDQRKATNDLSLQVEELSNHQRDLVNDVEAALLSGLDKVADKGIRDAVTAHRAFGLGTLTEVLNKDQQDAKDASSLEISDRRENNVSKELLKNDGALFKMIDSQFGSTQEDGRITDRDLVSVLQTIEKNPMIKSRFTAEEIKALEDLKGVFTDSNNTSHQRESSILNHDGWGQFWKFMSAYSPVDVLDVTRESLARGTAGDAIDSTTIAATGGAAGRAVGAGIAEVGAAAVRTVSTSEGGGSGPSAEGSNGETGAEVQAVTPALPTNDPSNGAAPGNGTADSSRDTAMPVEEERLGDNDYPQNVVTEPDSLGENRHQIVYEAQNVAAPVSDLVHINAGDGYWRIARRLVNYSGGNVSNARVAELTKALQEANGNKMLHPDQNLYELLQNEKVSSLLNA